MALGRKLFFAAIFLSLLTETTTASKDPWAGIGWYFHADLKSWIPQIGIALNPLEIVVMIILLAWLMRGRRDRRFRFERGLLFWPVTALAVMLVYGVLWGLSQSGSDFNKALFEVRALAYFVIAYFLVGILFTHRRDLDTFTWIVLIAAFLLGIECIIRYYVFIPNHIVGDLDYDHEDATVLAFALLLSGAMLLLGSTRRQKLFALVSMPVNLLALMLTHRRAGEAALAIGAVFLAVILLRVDRKLFLKIVPITALVFALYLGAYWNCSGGTLCQPARAITSQINPDPRDASSNQYRIIEKQDISLNILVHPLTGLGFGQPFAFYIQLPDLSFWPFWHYTPHDEILWVWMDMGMFGVVVFLWLIGSGIYRGGRVIQALSVAGDNKARALLAAGVCLILMQVSVSYVDLGLTSDRAMLLLGVVFGVIGHLPGILKRSINADDGARPGKGSAVAGLDAATPEAQVGVLAHVLITPVEPEPPRRTPTITRSRPRSRWEPNSSSPSWPQAGRSSSTDQASGAPFGNAPTRSRWAEQSEDKRY